jgi:hypothetical protein
MVPSSSVISRFLKAVVANVADMAAKGANMSGAPLQFPGFLEAGRGGEVKPDIVPTLAHNWFKAIATQLGAAAK